MTTSRIIVPQGAEQQILAAVVARGLARKSISASGETSWRKYARKPQLAPDGEWFKWLFLGGRGAGKTRSGAEWCHEQVRNGRRLGAAVAPTAADARDVMVEGPAGLMATCPLDLQPIMYEPSKRKITYANGAEIHFYSAEKPRQLRGPQHDFAWADELCYWKYPQDTWDNLMFGLRLQPDPRVMISTTPRPLKLLKKILKSKSTKHTISTTYDNLENLAPAFAEEVIEEYEGTRLGRQELHAEILDDIPGALWNHVMLDELRIDKGVSESGFKLPDMKRIVVAVDPAMSKTENSAETGIIVAGIGPCTCFGDEQMHGFVLADRTIRGSPKEWGMRVAVAYAEFDADLVVAETNNGGDLVEANIRAVDQLIPVKQVHASRGKYKRAEPVAALDEQGRIHHVGLFPELEDQMCMMLPEGSPDLVDRADARVWAFTELMLKQQRKWGAA
jgi:phage terminase large subunit-like protein